MTTGGDDRLSELSDDLLRRILYFVPSKEAASTTVLSRRWGTLWRSSGAVNLAVQVRGYQDLRYGGSGSAYQEAEEAFFSNREAFVHGAKAALSAAEAPITRLTLRVESDDHGDGGQRAITQFLCSSRDWQRNVDVVGTVLSHQAARHVEELRIAAVDVSNSFLYSEDENHMRHWLSGIYGLASLPSKTLCLLDLTRCDLTQSSSALTAAFPLPRLATLRLRFCSVELEDLQALSDAAPELTTVQLESVVFKAPPDSQQTTRFHGGHYEDPELDDTTAAEAEPPVLHLSFQAATMLVLALCGMEVQGSGDPRGRSRWTIDIDAPRLHSFKYKGLMRRFILRSVALGVARVDLHFLRHDPDPYHHYGSDSRDNEQETTRMLSWQFLHNFTNARTLKLKVGNDLKDIAAVHLRLYMHDVMRGPGTTAIHLIHGVRPPHAIERGGYFGDTAAIDDVVTEEPDVGYPALGRAQGTYMLASQHEEVLVVAVTVALTAGPYNGSTFAVAGSVGVYDDKAEAAVVGGTGRLRRAAGFLTWRMVKLVVSEGYVMVELDVHMSVPVSAAAAALGNWSSVAIE